LVLMGSRQKIGRYVVRFQIVSLEFLIDISFLRSHYDTELDLASNTNEY